MNKISIIVISVIFICTLPFGVTGEELQFPQSEEEFVEALSIEKTADHGIKTRGLTRSLYPRGVGGITPPEAPPKVGALVNFDHDSFRIKPESYALLDNFGNALNGGLSEAVIIVAGHTDSDGTDAYNHMLSIRRAQSVVDYLLYRHRIDAQRLVVKGYGEAFPISDNYTAKGKAKNRRVEFIRATKIEVNQ